MWSLHRFGPCGFSLVSMWLFLFGFQSGVLAASWETERVDTTGNVGQYSSIDTDGSDDLHISYYDATNSNLKYATNASGSWVRSIVDSSANDKKYTSIAVDLSDKVHICYYDDTDNALKYATKASGSDSWEEPETVDSGEGIDVGQHCSIALDSGDRVHISYRDSTPNLDLKYATHDGVDWVPVTVEKGTNLGEYTSIAVDSGGQVHISYYDNEHTSLKYATNPSGEWKNETVDNSTSSVGKYTSIAVDPSGGVHISYYDASNQQLKYATGAFGSWVIEEVDSSDRVGTHTSIGLDLLDQIHISYRDEANDALKYATNASGAWKSETVDSTSDNVGTYTSLAVVTVDGSDEVHISYYDAANERLRYATNTGTNGNGGSSDPDVFFNCFISTLMDRF